MFQKAAKNLRILCTVLLNENILKVENFENILI